MRSSFSWEAARSASLTAAVTRSPSISASSGSMTSGLISTDLTSILPVTTAFTASPPAVAVYSFSSSSAVTASICSCIF